MQEKMDEQDTIDVKLRTLENKKVCRNKRVDRLSLTHFIKHHVHLLNNEVKLF